MEWRDQGTLLSVRKHGENAAIIEVFTETHGRHAGVVRGGTSRKIAPVLQPGSQIEVTWRARLEDHLGAFTIEPVKSRAASVMSDRLTLAGLNAMTALLSYVLPEREAHTRFYHQTISVLDMIGTDEHWPIAYLRWELALLEEMGFGLDLSICAATGQNDDLFYVSPRTGRAVSRMGAGDWANRLLPLSPALIGKGVGSVEEILAGLQVTGHFLTTWLAPALGEKPVPAARQRLIDNLAR